MRKLLMVGASALLFAFLGLDEASAQRRGASGAPIDNGGYQGAAWGPGWVWGFPVPVAVGRATYGPCWYWNAFLGRYVNPCSPYCYGYGPCY